MNYELAKKLKDAGFPIKNPNMPDDWYERYSMWWPTLSELIEACGDGFSELKRINGRFWASDGKSKIGYSALFSESPEEAVANLWLELNKENL